MLKVVLEFVCDWLLQLHGWRRDVLKACRQAERTASCKNRPAQTHYTTKQFQHVCPNRLGAAKLCAPCCIEKTCCGFQLPKPLKGPTRPTRSHNTTHSRTPAQAADFSKPVYTKCCFVGIVSGRHGPAWLAWLAWLALSHVSRPTPHCTRPFDLSCTPLADADFSNERKGVGLGVQAESLLAFHDDQSDSLA